MLSLVVNAAVQKFRHVNLYPITEANMSSTSLTSCETSNQKIIQKVNITFYVFQIKRMILEKKHASTYRQALNCEQTVRTTWSPDSAIAALERISHPSPGLFPTATSGLLHSQNNLVFRISLEQLNPCYMQ